MRQLYRDRGKLLTEMVTAGSRTTGTICTGGMEIKLRRSAEEHRLVYHAQADAFRLIGCGSLPPISRKVGR